jgi:hypothetical protein
MLAQSNSQFAATAKRIALLFVVLATSCSAFYFILLVLLVIFSNSSPDSAFCAAQRSAMQRA